ncbi:hypothetical protein CDAR_502551 [Caerostris darwini]|uniref:Uncharacterized protein n=1 Tax=Caerostris darwini TaxID=1538125 RepID=A0AAV4VPG4_9ARAC|nr:hypothetical protein CDAR_502461 [Caerostris darwini]GIY72071.1 hypothetical protein CDAR_502551 [Caerostris darwini]
MSERNTPDWLRITLPRSSAVRNSAGPILSGVWPGSMTAQTVGELDCAKSFLWKSDGVYFSDNREFLHTVHSNFFLKKTQLVFPFQHDDRMKYTRLVTNNSSAVRNSASQILTGRV